MKTDTVLRCEGMRILSETLGIVEAERFIAVMLREPFDYTKWRQDLFQGVRLRLFSMTLWNIETTQQTKSGR